MLDVAVAFVAATKAPHSLVLTHCWNGRVGQGLHGM